MVICARTCRVSTMTIPTCRWVVQGQPQVLENAAAVEIFGLEGEFTLEPVRDLILTLNASWLHSRFKN